MWTQLSLRRLATLWVALATLLVAAVARAGAFDPEGRDWEGYSEFVGLARARLGDALVVTSGLDYGKLTEDDAVLIVHHERSLDVTSLGSFLAAGGRVALLDDYGTGVGLLQHYGIKRVLASAPPRDSLRDNPELAIAEAVSASELVDHVGPVITNHPTLLEHTVLTHLLEIPRRDGGTAGVLALAGRPGKGRLVVVGDPSAFMNSMLPYRGNRQFAVNLVTFLAPARDHAKAKVYLAEGAFAERGRFAGTPEASVARDALRALDLRSANLSPPVSHLLAAVIGMGVVVWIGSRAGKRYASSPPRLTQRVPLMLQGGAAGHAAAVGAPGTPRAHALLELGVTLGEELALALGLDGAPPWDELVARLLKEKLIDAASAAELRSLFVEVAQIDALVSTAAKAPLPRVTSERVLAASRLARTVARKARERAREQAA